MPPDVQTGIRLPQSTIDRADALAERFAEDPVVSAMGPPSRSGVMRLALAIGLELLERDPGSARRIMAEVAKPDAVG